MALSLKQLCINVLFYSGLIDTLHIYTDQFRTELAFLVFRDIEHTGKDENWVLPKTVTNVLECLNHNNEFRMYNRYTQKYTFCPYFMVEDQADYSLKW